MKRRARDEDETIDRYLLGELPAAERDAFEERYFVDDELFEHFVAVKDELIDAYARGELKGERRARFERHFLATPERRLRVTEARALVESATAAAAQRDATAASAAAAKHATTRDGSDSSGRWRRFVDSLRAGSPALRYALGLVVAAVALGLAWAAFEALRSRTTETAQVSPGTESENIRRGPESSGEAGRAEGARPSPTVSTDGDGPAGSSKATNERAQNDAAQTEGARRPGRDAPANRTGVATPNGSDATKPPPPAAENQIASLTLTPVLVREGGAENTLLLRPGTRRARLRLQIPPQYFASYRATVTTLDGERVRAANVRRGPSTRGGAFVALTLEASLLGRQDYLVKVEGMKRGGASVEVGEYYFRVKREAAAPER